LRAKASGSPGVSELAAEEAAVVAPGHRPLLTEQLRGGYRGAPREGAQRLRADGDHDARCSARPDELFTE
jgi:hypothetical protein